MENFYLVIVVILFALAISDLIVGVSNDAVNFLNSAIGSKAATFKVIMIVAALGIIAGAIFSNGMMEVARKGIFHPEFFLFHELMILFLAVMLTDIILLDTFNTLGLPTSTTVSIVFELLGAAVAIALFKVASGNNVISLDGIEKTVQFADYINSSKALQIILGILLSVVVAFIAGAIVQYLSRILFSFEFTKRMKYFGAIWGGMAITAITYFILIKGLKSASFAGNPMPDFITSEDVSMKQYVKDNVITIIGFSMILWTIVLQLLILARVNILKVIVLVGTFALAMAFAGNDLVNFIGVPVAGYNAFLDFQANGGDTGMLMEGMSGKKSTPMIMLWVSGAVMAITLWTSKKARSVVETSINLSKQQATEERFETSPIARTLVRGGMNFSNAIALVTPAPVKRVLAKQFDLTRYNDRMDKMGNEAPAFDMIRASVILMVSSIVISFATSQKLPLSTTYVTFMVAMGASLSDKAWGRESAVYRITGVISVIGGWFLTAFSAFTVAFIAATTMYFGGVYAIVIMILLVAFIVYRSNIAHKRKSKKKEEEKNARNSITEKGVKQTCDDNIMFTLERVSDNMEDNFKGLSEENRALLKSNLSDIQNLSKESKKLKSNINDTIRRLREEDVESGHHYIQVLDYLREMIHNQRYISEMSFEHVNNNHKPLIDDQVTELKEINNEMVQMLRSIVDMIKNQNFTEIDKIISNRDELQELVFKLRKKHVKRVKKEKLSTNAAVLYLSILHEYKNLLVHGENLLKAHRDFSNI